MRHHISKLNMEHLEKKNMEILAEIVLPLVPIDKPHEFSMDFTDDPYYGKVTPENEEYVVGGKYKKSTKWFYRYASLYLVYRDIKITVAILPVKKGVKDLEYLQRFVEVIEELNLKIKILLLDRGFYAVQIFRYLQEMDIPHIVPVKKKSNKLKKMLAVKRPRYEPFTVSSPQNGKVDVTIAIDSQYLKGRYDKRGKITYGYVVHGIDWKPKQVFQTYRKRFAIEASYRMRNIVRPKTSSKNPAFRYLLAIISMLLKNVWVLLKRKFFAKRQRGPRTTDDDRFRFDRFKQSVIRAFHRKARAIVNIPTLRPCG